MLSMKTPVTDRGELEDVRRHVDALVNSVNAYRVEVADLVLRLRADGVAISQLIARVDKLADEVESGVIDLELDPEADVL